MAGTSGGTNRGRASQAKWQKILDAAATTFAAQGYEATTIRDVAENVGMLGGSLYYYIDTKEDLLFALIDEFHRDGNDAIADVEEQMADRRDDPLAVLRAVCERHAEHNATHATRSAVFYHDFRHLNDDRKQQILKNRRRHERRVQELIEAAQAAGQIDPGKDAKLAALAVLSLLNATNTWYHPNAERGSAPIGVFLADLVLDGLAVRAPADATVPTAGRAPSRKAVVTAPAVKAPAVKAPAAKKAAVKKAAVTAAGAKALKTPAAKATKAAAQPRRRPGTTG